jgi:hypothetical protein
MGWNRIHGVDLRVNSVVVPQAFAGIACGDHGSAYAETGRLLSSEAAIRAAGLPTTRGLAADGTWSRQRKKRALS